MLGGVVVGLPFLFYLLLTPRFGPLAVLIAVSYAGAVAATYRRRAGLAGLLFAPMLVLVVYVALVVAGQVR